MDKLDETLKGLEYCISQESDNCSECPGDNCHVCTALELLKAQKPRVLTLEEIKNYEMPVWIDQKGYGSSGISSELGCS